VLWWGRLRGDEKGEFGRREVWCRMMVGWVRTCFGKRSDFWRGNEGGCEFMDEGKSEREIEGFEEVVIVLLLLTRSSAVWRPRRRHSVVRKAGVDAGVRRTPPIEIFSSFIHLTVEDKEEFTYSPISYYTSRLIDGKF
jgi:hypothetical protein